MTREMAEDILCSLYDDKKYKTKMTFFDMAMNFLSDVNNEHHEVARVFFQMPDFS